MRKRSLGPDGLKFIFIAIVLMVALHYLWGREQAQETPAAVNQPVSTMTEARSNLENDFTAPLPSASALLDEMAGAGDPLGNPFSDPFADQFAADQLAADQLDGVLATPLADDLGDSLTVPGAGGSAAPITVTDEDGAGTPPAAVTGQDAGGEATRVDTVVPAVAPSSDSSGRDRALPGDAPRGKAWVVIIIDDMGVDRQRTREVAHLPKPLTLSYLPYPERVDELVAIGRAQGHEIMLHMPMEAMDAAQDTGRYVLRTGMEPSDFQQVLDKNLQAFDGYVGINNHMGSRLTQDREAMSAVMATLRARDLIFIDSRTIGTSVAADTAAQFKVPHAVRDVFLDHDPSLPAVQAALAQTERVARQKGVAIAIGHPKDATIAALKAWLPTLADKGLVLVPASAVVQVADDSFVSPASTSSPSLLSSSPQADVPMAEGVDTVKAGEALTPVQTIPERLAPPPE